MGVSIWKRYRNLLGPLLRPIQPLLKYTEIYMDIKNKLLEIKEFVGQFPLFWPATAVVVLIVAGLIFGS